MSDRKRIFTSLLVLSLLLLLLSLWLLLRLSYQGFQEIHPLLPGFLKIGLFFLSALSALLVLLLLVSLGRGQIPLWAERGFHAFIRMLSPPSLWLGRLLGIPKDRIERSFIEVNNCLVKGRRKKYLLEDLLLLMPHCLQDSDCPVRITHEVKNCRSCGRCNVSELLAIAKACGARLRVASGGTSARQFILEYRPQAVIAVACERDLTSGIRESSPLPVIGIVNGRPYGYCLNTRVDPGRVREAIRLLTGREGDGKA
ncbi:MAG: DUF116 domain-containing protein [candidate division NC10 bacterium]|nr:DUF116 domain-containing protein [candidate division NC10 bacterium]